MEEQTCFGGQAVFTAGQETRKTLLLPGHTPHPASNQHVGDGAAPQAGDPAEGDTGQEDGVTAESQPDTGHVKCTGLPLWVPLSHAVLGAPEPAAASLTAEQFLFVLL